MAGDRSGSLGPGRQDCGSLRTWPGDRAHGPGVRLLVDPEAGGRDRPAHRRRRRSPHRARGGETHPMLWGSFPMVPWAGRLAHGRFRFGGRTYELPHGPAAARHPRHGLPPGLGRRARRGPGHRARPALAVRRARPAALHAHRPRPDVDHRGPRRSADDAGPGRVAPMVPSPRRPPDRGGRHVRHRRRGHPDRRAGTPSRPARGTTASPTSPRLHRSGGPRGRR